MLIASGKRYGHFEFVPIDAQVLIFCKLPIQLINSRSVACMENRFEVILIVPTSHFRIRRILGRKLVAEPVFEMEDTLILQCCTCAEYNTNGN